MMKQKMRSKTTTKPKRLPFKKITTNPLLWRSKIKIPLPNAPEDGVNLSPVAVLFAWLRYSY